MLLRCWDAIAMAFCEDLKVFLGFTTDEAVVGRVGSHFESLLRTGLTEYGEAFLRFASYSVTLAEILLRLTTKPRQRNCEHAHHSGPAVAQSALAKARRLGSFRG